MANDACQDQGELNAVCRPKKVCLSRGSQSQKNRCKIGHFQSNFIVVRVAMATQTGGFASLVDVSKDTHQGLHYGYKYWKSCFQNGSEEASGSWSSWWLHLQTPPGAMPQGGGTYFCRRTRLKNTQVSLFWRVHSLPSSFRPWHPGGLTLTCKKLKSCICGSSKGGS